MWSFFLVYATDWYYPLKQEPEYLFVVLTLYLIETPFNTFANRADPDQAALLGAAWSGPTLFALVDLTNFLLLCSNVNIYLYNYS